METAFAAFTAAASISSFAGIARAGTQAKTGARLFVPGYRSELATSGDRLLVDMTTGVSRVESDSGRVRGLFQSSGQNGNGPALPGTPSPGSQPGAPQSLAPNKLK